MARGPERATLEVGAQRDPAGNKWSFLIFGARRRIMHESKRICDTEHEARAAAGLADANPAPVTQ